MNNKKDGSAQINKAKPYEAVALLMLLATGVFAFMAIAYTTSVLALPLVLGCSLAASIGIFGFLYKKDNIAKEKNSNITQEKSELRQTAKGQTHEQCKDNSGIDKKKFSWVENTRINSDKSVNSQSR